MTTRMPLLPRRVTWSPRGEFVNVAPVCGRSSMLPGCPFWNSTVRRSYPAWVPVRTASTKPERGGVEDVIGAPAAQTNGGRFEPGVGVGLGLGLGEGDAVGVGDPIPGPTAVGGRFSGLATSRTPITTAAMTAAATPATQ